MTIRRRHPQSAHRRIGTLGSSRGRILAVLVGQELGGPEYVGVVGRWAKLHRWRSGNRWFRFAR
jgi:hypothetical protein